MATTLQPEDSYAREHMSGTITTPPGIPDLGQASGTWKQVLDSFQEVHSDLISLQDGQLIIGATGISPLADPTDAPILTPSTAGGSLTVGDYNVGYSYVNAYGQTLLSPQATITLTTGQTRIVVSAVTPLPDGVSLVNWYMSQAANDATLKRKTSNIGTSFNLDTLPTGAAVPTANTTGSSDHPEKGYITGSNGVAVTNLPGEIDLALDVTGDIDITGGVVTLTHDNGTELDPTGPTDGQVRVYRATPNKLVFEDVIATSPATPTAEGVMRVSVIPVDSAHPIAVGDNDDRMITVPITNTPTTDGDVLTLVSGATEAQWATPTGGGGGSDASTTVKGVAKLSVAPVSGTNPIAVGDNDSRMTNARTPVGTSLASGKVWVGDGSGVAAAQSVSGDATLANTGALTLASTAVTPGSYTSANITVDAKGRVTAAANGTGGGTTINSGTSFPGSPADGDLFIRTDTTPVALYRYNLSITTWEITGDGTSGGTVPDADATTKGLVKLTNDFGGTASLPEVAAIQGVVISGTPSIGDVLTATGSAAAHWAAPSGGGGGGSNPIVYSLISQGATISADTTYSSNVASNANDGDTSGTRWVSADTAPHWLVVDLGTATSIGKWRVWQETGSPDFYLKDYKLQSSPDNSTWTDQDTVTGNTLESPTRTFTPASARYWRLYITEPTQNSGASVGDTKARVYELQLYQAISVSYAPGSVYHNTNQSISTATSTALAFNSEEFDPYAFHDNSTNNSRLTVPSGYDGYFKATVNVQFAANTTGSREVRLKKNGSAFVATVREAATPDGTTNLVLSRVLQLVGGDYLEVFVYQNSGGSLNVEYASGETPNFTLERLG